VSIPPVSFELDAENNIVENNIVEGNVCGISVQMNSIGTIIRYNDIGIESVGNISWEPTIPSGTEIHFNNIVGNVDYGVKSSVWDESLGGAEEVDATNNWWGTPAVPAENMEGLIVQAKSLVKEIRLATTWTGILGFVCGSGQIRQEKIYRHVSDRH